MNIDLQLSPTTQTHLEQFAAQAGKSVDEIVREAIERHIADEQVEAFSAEETAAWKKRFREWAAGHPVQRHHVDVSRESIHRGRGQLNHFPLAEIRKENP